MINAGSTSIKYKVFADIGNLPVLAEGEITGIGKKIKNHQQAIKAVFRRIARFKNIIAVGHRVVHGGNLFKQPTLINHQVLNKINKLSFLAPLHNPPNLAGIKATQKLLPKVPQYAVFDTSFYADLPKESYTYALPPKICQKYGIRRYGFHGISHSYVAEKAADQLRLPYQKINLITCHLGGGTSITAIRNGQPIDTSMGFTPLEGPTMMTRSGDLDPMIPVFLAQSAKMKPAKIAKLLNNQSGLMALCQTADMLEIINRVKRRDKNAKFAFELYCYRIQKYIGAYLAILGRIDGLVFTGAIGAGNALTRQTIIRPLSILGNTPILTIITDEEWQIANLIKTFFTL